MGKTRNRRAKRVREGGLDPTVSRRPWSRKPQTLPAPGGAGQSCTTVLNIRKPKHRRPTARHATRRLVRGGPGRRTPKTRPGRRSVLWQEIVGEGEEEERQRRVGIRACAAHHTEVLAKPPHEEKHGAGSHLDGARLGGREPADGEREGHGHKDRIPPHGPV